MRYQYSRKIYTLLVIILLSGLLLLNNGCNGGPGAATDGDIVKVHYTGKLEDGTIFDTSAGREPLEFTLGEGKMIPGFEKAVRGMQIGELKTVIIPAEEAYGPHRDDLLLTVNRDRLPEGLDPEVDQQLQMQQTDGITLVAIVTDVSEETITVDANHPLAGKDLTFELELVKVN